MFFGIERLLWPPILSKSLHVGNYKFQIAQGTTVTFFRGLPVKFSLQLEFPSSSNKNTVIGHLRLRNPRV